VKNEIWDAGRPLAPLRSKQICALERKREGEERGPRACSGPDDDVCLLPPCATLARDRDDGEARMTRGADPERGRGRNEE